MPQKSKTSAKSKTTSIFTASKRKVVITLSIVVALIGLMYAAAVITYYVQDANRTANQAATIKIRDLILQHANQRDVALDPKTGDAYLTSLKLMIPAASLSAGSWLVSTPTGEEQQLSVSDSYTIGAAEQKMYNTDTIDALFENVPEFQACSRGVLVSYAKVDESLYGTLKDTVSLKNGKTIYLYADHLCTRLTKTLDSLKNVQPY
jgi:hypothetical protein